MIVKLSPDGSEILFSTYFGGAEVETANRVKIDLAGNLYVAGETQSTDFPTVSAFQTSFAGGAFDGYIVKFPPDGSSPIYSTYVGGTGAESVAGLAVDLAGNAFITGLTDSADYPTEQPFQPALGGFEDVFVTKLGADGTALAFSTYLGGGDNELAPGIDVDFFGNVYVAGRTASRDFPTVNAFQPTLKGFDAFVTKMRSDGQALEYSTFLGGSGADQALEVSVDLFGHARVIGQTRSADFPTAQPLQRAYGGGTSDAFIATLPPQGDALPFSTYLGGTGSEEGRAIAAAGWGAIFAAGTTTSPDFPVKAALQEQYSGFFNDNFLIKIIPGDPSR